MCFVKCRVDKKREKYNHGFFLLIGKSLKTRQRAFTTVSGKRVISV